MRGIEISKGYGLSLGIYHSEDSWGVNIGIPGFKAFIPIWPSNTDPNDIIDIWGFSWMNGPDWGFWESLHLNWGSKCKIICMPWSWDHYSTDTLIDPELNEWYRHPKTKGFDAFAEQMEYVKQLRWTETHKYLYFLKSGEVQKRNASIYVQRMEWRWLWFKWLPLIRKQRQFIHVDFDGEVGEKTGSWKGGCIGCSYDMKPGETPAQTLRRMESERRF